MQKNPRFLARIWQMAGYWDGLSVLGAIKVTHVLRHSIMLKVNLGRKSVNGLRMTIVSFSCLSFGRMVQRMFAELR
jgi:hypothetical protein